MKSAAALFVALLTSTDLSGASENSCLACDREMRKTIESVQAWRRQHDGRYPARLVDLAAAGLMPYEGAICPEVRGESYRASAAHDLVTSRIEGGDPPGYYEYEMSDVVLQSDAVWPWLPPGTRPYTRQKLKTELIRRPLYEQVAMLRCFSHRASAPTEYIKDGKPSRNCAVEGATYWSGQGWEQVWLADVPYCCRDANVLFGLKGPPFFSGSAPELPEALDLRPWSCAFGDHPWWWTCPMFEQGANFQTAATLRPFFAERHGRKVQLGGVEWWIDGLVQLQGRILTDNNNAFREPGLLAFLWERRGLKVGRTFRDASWLQGTVWATRPGETAGWLVWHFADGKTERVAIVYGQTTARFWAEREQETKETGFPIPAWSHRESKDDIDSELKVRIGKDRLLRLYQQTWTNPRPNVVVTSLDFVSNTNSPAAPFIIAVNVHP